MSSSSDTSEEWTEGGDVRENDALTRMFEETPIGLGGVSALLLQIAHPKIATAVSRHSDFQRDALGRLSKTLHLITAVAFGRPEDARVAIERMRRKHRLVMGTSPSTGSYSARDPELQLWVWATLVYTCERFVDMFMVDVDEDDSTFRRKHYDQWKDVARRLGIPGDMLPPHRAAFHAYVRHQAERTLIANDESRAIASFILDPWDELPWYVPTPSFIKRSVALLTSGILPSDKLRQSFGLRYDKTSFDTLVSRWRHLMSIASFLRLNRIVLVVYLRLLRSGWIGSSLPSSQRSRL